MGILKNSFFFLFILIFIVSFANNFQWKDIQLKLFTFYSLVETYQSDFIQTNYWSSADVSKTSEGSLFYTNEHVLLKYVQPDGQIMLLDSTMVQLFNPASNQLLITSSLDIPLRPSEIIKYYVNEDDQIIIQKQDDKTIISVSSENYKQVKLEIKNNLLLFFSLQDQEENLVSYQFKNIKINQKFDSSLFDISFPEDVQIIDRREN